MKISKAAADEGFFSRDLGVQIDIAALIDAINGADDLQPFLCPTDELLSMRRADHLDQRTLAGMSDRRRDEPVVIAVLLGAAWVIDGNHRLEKRRREGFTETQAIEVPFELLEPHLAPLGF